MSQEYYVICRRCKAKVHVGCVGVSGLQFWSGEQQHMTALRKLLETCLLHIADLGFTWEQSEEDDTFREIEA